MKKVIGELEYIMEEWKEISIEDALEVLIDYRGKTPKKSEQGIPTLSAKSVKMSFIDYSQCYYISEDEYKKYMARGFPKKGDVLLTTEAPLGMVARLDNEKVALGQRLITLRGKKELLDNGYLLYYFQSPQGQYNLKSKETGTTVTGIKQSVFRKLKIPLPPLPTQQKIAQILSSLDDKIELNNKINDNLEQQAQVIFKSWFVDFEPFGGEIPSDWKVGILSDVAKLSAGGDKPKETSDKKNEVYNIPIYSNGLDNFGLYGFTNKATIFEESVTVSARGTIGFVCLRTTPYVPIVRLVSVIPKCTNVSAKYLYLSLRNKNIAGTGTTQQQLTVPAFSKENILIPPEEVMTSFTNLVQPMFSKIFELRTENEKLATIRDILLPKLMAGELEVN